LFLVHHIKDIYFITTELALVCAFSFLFAAYVVVNLISGDNIEAFFPQGELLGLAGVFLVQVTNLVFPSICILLRSKPAEPDVDASRQVRRATQRCMHLLNTERTKIKLLAVARATFCVEGPLFLLEIQSFLVSVDNWQPLPHWLTAAGRASNKKSHGEILDLATNIFEVYLQEGSPFQVNVSHSTRQQVEAELSHQRAFPDPQRDISRASNSPDPQRDISRDSATSFLRLFDAARDEVADLIATNLFPRLAEVEHPSQLRLASGV
jgi:hypothetical protein